MKAGFIRFRTVKWSELRVRGSPDMRESLVETMTKDAAIVGTGPVGLHAALKVALLLVRTLTSPKYDTRSNT